jgi:hypothetical protein
LLVQNNPTRSGLDRPTCFRGHDATFLQNRQSGAEHSYGA